MPSSPFSQKSFPPAVVAAIIKKDQQYFICKRPANKHHGGFFEFPGGKVKPGETHQEALIRECKEELAISINVHDLFYHYPGEQQEYSFPIFFYLATISDQQEPILLEHSEGRFVYPLQMKAFPFAPADSQVVHQILSSPHVPSPPYTHLIWDFDGTLFNSYPQIAKALSLVLQTLGIQEELSFIHFLAKTSLRHAITTLQEKHHIPLDIDLFRLYHETESRFPMDYILPYPGIIPLLTSLSQGGITHYLYTHRNHSTFSYLQEHHILCLFKEVITKEKNFPAKPSPKAIEWVMEHWHIPQSSALMIGDRAIDVQS
ncbi:MAG: HAD hydrolase-like protein, partial [Clostridiales bacterium]|nr:HAD hydrolase-like protein [Clostridiales bacterium]